MNLDFKTHITIPRQPREGLALLAWAKDVNYAIRQLANISSSNIPYKTPKGININGVGRNYTHPWKCIANGNNTITVLSGNMWTYRNNGTGYAGDPIDYTAFPLEFDGVNDLTITATGYVYALCDIAQILVLDDTGPSGIPFYSERDGFSGTPEVIFSTDAPAVYSPQTDARNFAIPLASVGWNSEESIANVLKQYVVDDIWPVGGSATYEPTP
jgi:hypothetical protein